MKLIQTSRQGQTILPEYVVIFFLAIAALVTITIYVQRALQGRVFDARNYMTYQANKACRDADAAGGGLDCKGATGSISPEYEPYVAQINSEVARNQELNTDLVTTNDGGMALKKVNDRTEVTSKSVQLPPKDAN